MEIRLPHYVQKIINIFADAGFEAYAVGGCIRDTLLGKTPFDWDICTNASPEETKSVFSSFKTVDTGIKHGTVTVFIEHTPVEITTFRIDGEYTDFRRPEKVTFTTSLTDDLSRRDFTVNAMAYSPEHGLIDPFCGRDDLSSKTIRCVGQADKRFNEDALRILRALRFSSVLGFDIEKETAQAIHVNAHLLSKIASERINTELCKLLSGKNVSDVLLSFRDVISVFIPELKPCFDFDQKSKYHIYDVWEHTVISVSKAPVDKVIRLTMLLHDIGKPCCFTVDEKGNGHFYNHPEVSVELSRKVLQRLKFDNQTKNDVLTLIKYHDKEIGLKRSSLLKLLNEIGDELFLKLLDVKNADNLAQNPEYDYTHELEKLHDLYLDIKRRKLCYSLKELKISGKDLIELGICDGNKIGTILNLLLNEVMAFKLENEFDSLIKRAKKEI